MDDMIRKCEKMLADWVNMVNRSPSRAVFHFGGMSIFTRRKLRPWCRVMHNRITGRTMYMGGLLYFSLVMSNPFK